MVEFGVVLDLNEMEEDEFYYLVVNCADSIDEYDDSHSFIVNACKAFVSSHKDALDLANEYLAMMEDELMETEAGLSPINPFVYYGRSINTKRLPGKESEYVKEYLVLVPNTDWETYTMLPCKGLDGVAYCVEKIMKEKQGLDIDDVVIFHCSDVDLIQQIPHDFDTQAVEMDFVSESTGEG
jgi:hypothetical protein